MTIVCITQLGKVKGRCLNGYLPYCVSVKAGTLGAICQKPQAASRDENSLAIISSVVERTYRSLFLA